MPGARLPMRKIRDVLRLTAAGMSSRNIALSLSIGATTVIDFLQRARSAEMSWPLPEDMTEEALEARLFPASTALAEIKARRPQPDWQTIHRELRRKGVTLQLLWEEHRAAHPNGYGYSRFCEIYRAWEARLSPTMRQTHVAGERLFVDYAGTTLEVINGLTGEVITAQLFVAALGASSYTYAEATRTQGLADWIGSHTRAFAFIGGVTAMVVSDNLKSGITKACFYEPGPGPRRNDGRVVVRRHLGVAAVHRLITSQLPVEAWHEVIGEPTFADAILDRIVHNAYRFALEGPSMRKPEAADATAPANGADSANALSIKPTKGTRK